MFMSKKTTGVLKKLNICGVKMFITYKYSSLACITINPTKPSINCELGFL